jgi:serine/threonine protein kinase
MSGLKKLHDNNMAHGDLKPSNIFITEDGNYKLGIFIFV